MKIDLQQELLRLNSLVSKNWQTQIIKPANPLSRSGSQLELDILLDSILDDGASLNIGGNSFELVGRRHIDNIQYQFSDIDFLTSRDGIVFVTQQDFNGIFYANDSSVDLKVWGGLAGGEFTCFGESIASFICCIADCFSICYEKYGDAIRDGNGYKSGFVNDVRDAVSRNNKASFEGWFEYFYG